jgi:hypothetical protein
MSAPCSFSIKELSSEFYFVSDLENLVILWRTGGVKIPQARPPEGWVRSNEGKICLGKLVMAVISLEKPVKRR